MAVQERFQVTITEDSGFPPEVIAQIKWDNGESNVLKRTAYQETRRYPSIQALVSQVSRERILRRLQLVSGMVMNLAGISTPALITTGIILGDSDVFMRTVAGVTSVGSLVGAYKFLVDGGVGLEKASAILGQVQRRVDYSIAPTQPLP